MHLNYGKVKTFWHRYDDGGSSVEMLQGKWYFSKGVSKIGGFSKW